MIRNSKKDFLSRKLKKNILGKEITEYLNHNETLNIKKKI